MIAVIQRCSQGKVTVSDKVVGEISHGLVILLGVQKNDTENDAEFLVNKICGLRIFNDENDKMNLSIKDVNGSALVIRRGPVNPNVIPQAMLNYPKFDDVYEY